MRTCSMCVGICACDTNAILFSSATCAIRGFLTKSHFLFANERLIGIECVGIKLIDGLVVCRDAVWDQ